MNEKTHYKNLTNLVVKKLKESNITGVLNIKELFYLNSLFKIISNTPVGTNDYLKLKKEYHRVYNCNNKC